MCVRRRCICYLSQINLNRYFFFYTQVYLFVSLCLVPLSCPIPIIWSHCKLSGRVRVLYQQTSKQTRELTRCQQRKERATMPGNVIPSIISYVRGWEPKGRCRDHTLPACHNRTTLSHSSSQRRSRVVRKKMRRRAAGIACVRV